MEIQQQITQLRQQIANIGAEGPIAPDNVWINEFRAGSRRKQGYQYYTYYKLMEAIAKRSKTGKIQGRQIAYLGAKNSLKYRAAKAAIDRRNKIQQLEAEIHRLEALM